MCIVILFLLFIAVMLVGLLVSLKEAGLVVFMTSLAVGIYFYLDNKKKKKRKKEEDSRIIHQNKIECTRFLEENSFIISKSIEVKANNSELFWDDVNHEWYYKNYLNSSLAWKIYKYKDLLSFHIFEDGMTIQSGNVDSALIGGAILGGIGAIAGASASKTLTGQCNQLQIQIIVDDIENHEINIILISSQNGIAKNSIEYTESIALARNIISTLEYVKNKAR